MIGFIAILVISFFLLWLLLTLLRDYGTLPGRPSRTAAAPKVFNPKHCNYPWMAEGIGWVNCELRADHKEDFHRVYVVNRFYTCTTTERFFADDEE